MTAKLITFLPVAYSAVKKGRKVVTIAYKGKRWYWTGNPGLK